MAPPADPVLVACKHKLAYFRIKELKDVLHQLGLPKLGKKQELLERVMTALSNHQDHFPETNGLPKANMVGREMVVKIVEDTFMKMQDPASAVASSRSHIEVGLCIKPKKKQDDSAELNVKVRCPCGNSKPNNTMIQCVDPQCNVRQHVGCVVIPENEKSADSISPDLPSCFYCEMCRVSRADPFWVTIDNLLLPVLVGPSPLAADGSYTIQYTAKSFQLSRANREMLQNAEYDIQVWCILLNDKVPFRMHWPLHSDMEVNGIPVKVVNRQPTQKLGANGRDDGPILTDYLMEGPNKIALSRKDPRTFCLGIRIAKRRSLEQVLNLVPREQHGEKFDDALARVRRCVGGGTEANNADSDSDVEVMADSVSVNLRCPMTASRIRIAGRFKPCAHMGCFDLEAFIEINQRSRKWQCPICLKNYSLENIIIDPYFNRITSLIKSCGDDTSEIDVKPDGSWRVKGTAELKGLTQWHRPDGTLCVATDTVAKPKMCTVKHEMKEEPLSEEVGYLKLGFRKNSDGKWEISKRGDTDLVLSSDDDHARHMENKKGINLTCSIDDTDIEDKIYNPEAARNDYPMTHVHDLDYSPADENASPAATEQDIIILSDSDDDAVRVLSPSSVDCVSTHDTGHLFPPNNSSKTSGVFGEQPGGCPTETSFLSLEEGFGDLEPPLWEYPLSTRDDGTYQIFDIGTAVTDSPGKVPANYQSKHELVSGVAANPVGDGHDGGLQPCTSTERDGAITLANLGDHTQTCDYGQPDKWSAARTSVPDEGLTNAKNASQKRRNPEGGTAALDALAVGSQGPSARRRFVLSIDSDSDD